jgi:hypothetical protein
MTFKKISPGPNGGVRYINLEQIVSAENGSNGLKLKMSNGEVIEHFSGSEKAEILAYLDRHYSR